MDSTPKKRVLIVEDDAALRLALSDKLRREDFSVLVATDGEKGLKSALKDKPDLILLDIIMPKMNGVDVLRKLREDSWGETVPVLLLTNDSNPEHMHATLKVDAADYLVKSDWTLDAVVLKIKETLRL
jgi:two-component system response regulator MprA